jgi:D-alanyl-D-alanine carboxypeptidase
MQRLGVVQFTPVRCAILGVEVPDSEPLSRGPLKETPFRQPHFDLLADQRMAELAIPGMSVAVLERGALVHAGGYGLANMELQVPTTVETVYQTASVGKQFTAALLLLLAEEGSVSLDQEIVPYFEELPAEWGGITIRHLLSHTSGIVDTGYDELNLRLDYTDAELIAAIAAVPLESLPGTRWHYSNSGYVLLGILVGRIAGRFYGDLLGERIFAPLDMTTARVISEEDIILNRAAGYRRDGAAWKNQEYVSPTLNRTADGALYVSILDMAKWDRALANPGVLLSGDSLDRMWRPAELSDATRCPYGLGWSLGESPQGRIAEHDGGWQGFSAHILRYLDEGLTIIVLANLADAPLADLAREFAAVC